MLHGRAKHSFFLVMTIGFFMYQVFPVLAEDVRGMKSIVATDRKGTHSEKVNLYKKTVAVIVGINKYPNLKPSEQLKNAVNDAKGVREVLDQNFLFDEYYELYDEQATKNGLMTKLAQVGASLTKDDAMFVFFAGHGTTVTTSTTKQDTGYILPFDGSFNEKEYWRNISMVDLRDNIGNVSEAKHIFFCIDACYSGSIFTKTRGDSEQIDQTLEYLKTKTDNPVRFALTAGDKGQQVLDSGLGGHSVFTGRFIEALTNTKNFITAASLAETISDKVFNDANRRGFKQTPQSGRLSEGSGDFIFLRKDALTAEGKQKEADALEAQIAELQRTMASSRDKEEQEAIRIKQQQAEAKRKILQAEADAAMEQEVIRRAQDERNRQIGERELQQKKELEATQAALNKAIAEKRSLMDAMSRAANSPDLVIKLVKEYQTKIQEIKKDADTSRKKAIADSTAYYSGELTKANALKKDRVEKTIEFETRKNSEIERLQRQQFEMQQQINIKYDRQTEELIAPFNEKLQGLLKTTFELPKSDVKVFFGEFNADLEQFPVAIKASVWGVMVDEGFVYTVQGRNAAERRVAVAKVDAANSGGGYMGNVLVGIDAFTFKPVVLKVAVIDIVNNASIVERITTAGIGYYLNQRVADLEKNIAERLDDNTYPSYVSEAKSLLNNDLPAAQTLTAAKKDEFKGRLNALNTILENYRADQVIGALDSKVRNLELELYRISDGTLDILRTQVVQLKQEVGKATAGEDKKGYLYARLESIGAGIEISGPAMNRTAQRQRDEQAKKDAQAAKVQAELDEKAWKIKQAENARAAEAFWDDLTDTSDLPPRTNLAIDLMLPNFSGSLVNDIGAIVSANESAVVSYSSYTSKPLVWGLNIDLSHNILRYAYFDIGASYMSADLMLTKSTTYTTSSFPDTKNNYSLYKVYGGLGLGLPIEEFARLQVGGFMGYGSFNYGEYWTSTYQKSLLNNLTTKYQSLVYYGAQAVANLYVLEDMGIDVRFKVFGTQFTSDGNAKIVNKDLSAYSLDFGLVFGL